MLTCDETREALPLLALGAVDGEEAGELRAHLESCAECRRELRELEAVASAIALTVPGTRAPESLRARVLTRVHAEHGERAAGTLAAAGVSARVGWPRWWSRRRLWWATGAVAAVVVVGWAAFLQVEVLRLDSRNAWLEREAARSREVAPVLRMLAEGRDVVSLPMEKAPSLESAAAVVLWDPEYSRCSLVIDGLPPPPRGQHYHLWLWGPSGDRFDGGALQPQGGTAVVSVDLERWKRSDYRVVVALEPAAQPTPVLWANLVTR